MTPLVDASVAERLGETRFLNRAGVDQLRLPRQPQIAEPTRRKAMILNTMVIGPDR